MARERPVILDLPTEPRTPSVAFVPYNPGIVKTLVGLHCIVDTSRWDSLDFEIGFDEVFRIQYVRDYADGGRDLWLTRMNGRHAGVLVCGPLLPGLTFVQLKTEESQVITVTRRRWAPAALVRPIEKGDIVRFDGQLYRVDGFYNFTRPDGERAYMSRWRPDMSPEPDQYSTTAAREYCVRYEQQDVVVHVPKAWGSFLGHVVRIGDPFVERLRDCLVVGESETLTASGRSLTMIELDVDPVPTIVTESCNVTIVPDYQFDDNPLAARHAKLLRAAVKLRGAMSSLDAVRLVEKLIQAI